jgi:hypothetical protein
VHGDRQAHEIGQYGRTPRPGFERAFVVGCARGLDLGHQVIVDERAFFN